MTTGPTGRAGGKVRLDELLVTIGLFATRAQARTAVMAGEVLVDGRRADKAGLLVAPTARLEVSAPALRYVSRGGLKLEKALHAFNIDVRGALCLDVGASTGGFTDCLLQHGAREVWAVDVGYGQLAWKLRTDPRVRLLERTNARHLNPAELPPFDVITVDTSFISVTVFLDVLARCLAPGGSVIWLVKPQFEAGPRLVGKKGVVRDPEVHVQVLSRALQSGRLAGLTPAGLTFSPIKGPEGNIEFLAWFTNAPEREGKPSSGDEEMLRSVVADAHATLR